MKMDMRGKMGMRKRQTKRGEERKKEKGGRK